MTRPEDPSSALTSVDQPQPGTAANDLSSLVGHIYSYFQQQYGSDTGGLGPGSLFLAFERLGTSVSPGDFKLRPDDPDFNPAMVQQHGSDLVDFVAQLDSEGFIRARGDLSPSVEGQYQMLLTASSPIPADDAVVAGFLQLKGQAQRRFDESKLNMNHFDFWPAVFSPQFWFDEHDPVWKTYSSSEGSSSGPGPSGPPPGGIKLGRWAWRVIAPEQAPAWNSLRDLSHMHASEVLQPDVLRSVLTDSVLSRSRLASPQLSRLVSDLDSAALTPAVSLSLEASIGSAVSVSRPISLSPAVSTQVELDGTLARRLGTVLEPGVAPSPRVSAMLVKNLALSSFVLQLPEQSASSSSFTMTFDYALVNVSRPWISANLLNAPDWFIHGQASGTWGGGIYSAPTVQPFALLPSKILVVKNLRISAQWSQEDRSLAQSSASLGPFSMVSRSFENDTLSCPGMQIIGWLCQVMPPLPPAPDPAVHPVT